MPEDKSSELDMKQHDALRADIQALESEGRKFDAAAILAVAALWTWALKDQSISPAVAGTIGALLAVFSGLKAIAAWHLISRKAAYIRELETHYSAVGGFESWFKDRRPKSAFRIPVLIFLGLAVISGAAGACFRPIAKSESGPKSTIIVENGTK